MEPVAMVLAALAAATTGRVSENATDAVMDAYTNLRELLRHRFAGRTAAEIALDEYERNPDAWKGALEAELHNVDAGNDDEVVDATRQLIQLISIGAGERGEYYSVHGRTVRGIQVGDGNIQSNTFSPPIIS